VDSAVPLGRAQARRARRCLAGRHVVELAQRPDGGSLAVISWASPEIDPGVRTNELHVVDPQTGAVRDLGRIGVESTSLTCCGARARGSTGGSAKPPSA
jgi:hypothetical protein